MRHFFANVVIYAIVATLVVGAAAFAWMRSSQLAITTESVVVAGAAPAAAHGFTWQALGRRSYVANCLNCHGGDGAGWDQYPPVAGAFGFAGSPEGRNRLIDLTIYGIASENRRVPMPPMGHIPDVEIAAVLNHILVTSAHVAGVDPPPLFLPEDIAVRRGQRLRPHDVARR